MEPWTALILIVAFFFSMTVFFIWDIRDNIKKGKQREEEINNWAIEENKKPKFRVKVFTKSGEVLYSEPRDAYHFWLAFSDAKVTSYQAAHEYASNIMKSSFFRLGDKYVPTCDIKDVSVVPENEA